jgi:hypothetical protein
MADIYRQPVGRGVQNYQHDLAVGVFKRTGMQSVGVLGGRDFYRAGLDKLREMRYVVVDRGID